MAMDEKKSPPPESLTHPSPEVATTKRKSQSITGWFVKGKSRENATSWSLLAMLGNVIRVGLRISQNGSDCGMIEKQ